MNNYFDENCIIVILVYNSLLCIDIPVDFYNPFLLCTADYM